MPLINISLDRQSTFIKYRVIAELPGYGKSRLINYIILYAISKGLKVGISAMQVCCAVHIGSLHLYIFFILQ